MEKRHFITNTHDYLMLVLTELEGQDYWLGPGESVELRAEVESESDNFEIQETNEGVTIWPSSGMGSIAIFSEHEELQCGYQRPKGWATVNTREKEKSHMNNQSTKLSPWKLTGWICAGVIGVSVLLCVVMAVVRSNGLTAVTVTALEDTIEPRDHDLPFVKQREALPDYELVVHLKSGDSFRLGTKPDTSAADGLTWHLNEPVSIADVTSVRLQDQDKVISDTIAEAQILGDSITEKGYRFEVASKRSMAVGVQSFFGTPIGQAITAGFCIAMIIIVLSAFCA